MKLDVLAIGAHPDDIELACAGTLIKLVKLGRKVGVLDLTMGELGTRGTQDIREAEAREATKILGIDVRENLRMKDGNIEISQSSKLQLIQFIRKYRPDILLIPHWLERHPDHEHGHRLCREAWFIRDWRRSKPETREFYKCRIDHEVIFTLCRPTNSFLPSLLIYLTNLSNGWMRFARSNLNSTIRKTRNGKHS